MHGDVAVTLLKSVVLLDVVQVVSANDHSSLHLGGLKRKRIKVVLFLRF